MTDKPIYDPSLIFRSKAKRIINKVLTYLVLIIVALSVLLPLYIVLITSLKGKSEAMDSSFSWWPSEIDLHGYKEVFTYTSGSEDSVPTVIRGFINTLIVSVPTSVIGVLVAALAAFAFAKLEYKNVLFAILLGTMMIPGTITLIPSYVIFDKIGWVDTFLPLMIPAMLGGASCVFFLRQFYFSIPNDLMDAAKIDGLGNFGIFFSIMLPLSMPALIAQLVLAFVSSYNAYLGPLLYLQSPEKYTLQIALQFFKGTYTTDWAVVMAGATVSLIPTLALYLFGQKYFIEGIATSGMKL